jgi:Na+-driven multidrug efflux pump
MLCLCMIRCQSYNLPIKSLPKIPKMNSLNQKIWNLTKPATLNYMMGPIVGMIDTFWIGQLGNPSQLAGAGTAEQLFSIFYMMNSFLPTIMSPKINHLHNQQNNEKIKQLISCSLILSVMMSLISTTIMLNYSNTLLNISLSKQMTIFNEAYDYFVYRSFGMIFTLNNCLIFGIFRGFMKIDKVINIIFKSQIINIVLNPIFMTYIGVKGVAISSVLSDIYVSFHYLKMLYHDKQFTLKMPHFVQDVLLLLKQGIFIQSKNTITQCLYFYTSYKILNMENGDILLASHIILIKLLQLSQICFSGLFSVSSVIINSEFKKKNIIDSLLRWGIGVGISQSILIEIIQYKLNWFSNEAKVIEQCLVLIHHICLYQATYGLSYILEGILIGFEKYKQSFMSSMIQIVPVFISLYMDHYLSQIWNHCILSNIGKCIYCLYIIYEKNPKK